MFGNKKYTNYVRIKGRAQTIWSNLNICGKKGEKVISIPN